MLNSADMINFLEVQMKLFLTSYEVVFNLFNQIYVVFALISVGWFSVLFKNIYFIW